jgi:hypothetical protein
MKSLKILIVVASAAAALAVGLGAQAQPATQRGTLLGFLQAAGAQLSHS